jgi:hypothetical protein
VGPTVNRRSLALTKLRSESNARNVPVYIPGPPIDNSCSVIKGAGYELDGTRLVSAMGALIDYQSGEVIAQEDPR